MRNTSGWRADEGGPGELLLPQEGNAAAAAARCMIRLLVWRVSILLKHINSQAATGQPACLEKRRSRVCGLNQ